MKSESHQNEHRSSEELTDQYYRESLEIAQRMSERWRELREKIKKTPYLLAEYPELTEVDFLSHPPISGIQRWFESKIKTIENIAGNDINVKSRMMYRLKEDLERIQQQLNDVFRESGE